MFYFNRMYAEHDGPVCLHQEREEILRLLHVDDICLIYSDEDEVLKVIKLLANGSRSKLDI